MSDTAVLHYVPGRGRAELLRLTLSAVGIKFEHGPYITTAEQYGQLCAGGRLQFDQLPLLQYKGVDMVQTVATARYFAYMGDLMGDNAEDRWRIDMLSEGGQEYYSGNLMLHCLMSAEQYDEALERTSRRYTAKFEQILSASDSGYLVGGRMSLADIAVMPAHLTVEERKPQIFDRYPKCKEHLARMKQVPSIKQYLASDKRFPPNTPEYMEIVKAVFDMGFLTAKYNIK